MSELNDEYKAQMPEKCLTCPVFASFVAVAELNEKSGINVTNAMIEVLDMGNGPLQNPEADALWLGIHSTLLEMSTDSELESIKALSYLARRGPDCPTPKRGGVPGEVLLSRIVSWLTDNKVCQNPGLQQIVENI